MKSTRALVALAIASGICACATTSLPPGTATMASAEETYRTGSRLPHTGPGEQPLRTIGKEEWRLDVTRGIANAVRGN